MSSSLCGASNKSKVIFLFNIAITLSTFKRKSADNFGQKAAFQNKLKSWHKAPDFSGKKVQCSRELKTKLAGRISAEYVFIHARGKAKIGFLFIYLLKYLFCWFTTGKRTQQYFSLAIGKWWLWLSVQNASGGIWKNGIKLLGLRASFPFLKAR